MKPIDQKIQNLEKAKQSLLTEQNQEVARVLAQYEDQRKSLGKKLGALKRQKVLISKYETFTGIVQEILANKWDYQLYANGKAHSFTHEGKEFIHDKYFFMTQADNDYKTLSICIRKWNTQTHLKEVLFSMHYTITGQLSKEEAKTFAIQELSTHLGKCQAYLKKKT